MKRKRAVVSARVSQLTEDSTSPESQKSRGERKAEDLGAEIVGYARDLDVSAFKITPWDRPELGKWLRDPDSFDILITRGIDRLARNLGDLVKMIDWGAENDVRLVFLEQDLDLNTPFGRFTAHILGSVAQLEAELTQSRILGAREYMRSVARWPAGNPYYGYRLTAHESGKGYALEVDPPTAAIMREIVRRVIEGESLARIAQDLNNRGVLSPRALNRLRAGRATTHNAKHQYTGPPLWSQAHLRAMLRNEAMRGLVWENTDGRRDPVLDDDGVQLAYSRDALIDLATWQKLQAELDRRMSANKGQRAGKALLLGMLYCDECGHRLYRTAHKNLYRYACRSDVMKSTGCAGSAVNEPEALEVIESRWLNVMGDVKVLEKRETAGENHDDEIALVQSQLDDLQALFERGSFKGAVAMERYANNVSKLGQRLEYLRSLPSIPSKVELVESEYFVRDIYEELTVEERIARLKRYDVKFYVQGKIRDGSASARMYSDTSVWKTPTVHVKWESLT